MATRAIAPAQAIEGVERGFGLSTSELARALEVPADTVQRWRAGEGTPPPEVWTRLAAWYALYQRLVDTFADGPDGAREWLATPHRSLAWQTPAELAREGRFDRVEATLGVLEAGIFL